MTAVQFLLRMRRFAYYAVASFVSVIVLYVSAAAVFLLFPANADVQAATLQTRIDNAAHVAPKVRIYVLSNGVHTDVVLPVKSDAFDWRLIFPKTQFLHVFDDADLIAFGWGDAEFYLQTPSWSALKFSTAIRALMGANQALLHVEYLAPRQLPERIFPLDLTTQQYRRLRAHIMQTLALPSTNAQVRFAKGYGASDAFFQARGTYSPIYTCNSWTGDALRQAGVKISRWTPFPVSVTWHLAESKTLVNAKPGKH